MSKNTKIVVSVVVLVIIIGGLFWYSLSSPSNAVPTDQGQVGLGDRESGGQGAPLTPTPTMTTSADTSNSALQQDSAAIDAQMNGLNADTANVGQ